MEIISPHLAVLCVAVSQRQMVWVLSISLKGPSEVPPMSVPQREPGSMLM